MVEPCGSCDGTGWLYTSSWDDEGFPCPSCSAASSEPTTPADDPIGPDWDTR